MIAGGQVSAAVQELLPVAAGEQVDRHELVGIGRVGKKAALEQVDLRTLAARGRQEPDGRPLPASQVRHLGSDLYARVDKGEPSCVYGARPEVIAGGARADDRAGPGISGRLGPAVGPQGQAIVHADRRGKVVRGVEAVLTADRRAGHRDARLHKPWRAVRTVIAYVGIPVIPAQRVPGEDVVEQDAAAGGILAVSGPCGEQSCCSGESSGS